MGEKGRKKIDFRRLWARVKVLPGRMGAWLRGRKRWQKWALGVGVVTLIGLVVIEVGAIRYNWFSPYANLLPPPGTEVWNENADGEKVLVARFIPRHTTISPEKREKSNRLVRYYLGSDDLWEETLPWYNVVVDAEILDYVDIEVGIGGDRGYRLYCLTACRIHRVFASKGKRTLQKDDIVTIFSPYRRYAS